MSSDHDAKLRRLFRAAHDEDRAAPDFDRLLSRPRARRRRVPLWLPIATAAALLATTAVPLLKVRRERQALEFARELAAWRAPTDSLFPEAYRSTDLFGDLGGPSVLGSTNDMVRWRR